jgi:thiamine biosynthesis lipoprotein
MMNRSLLLLLPLLSAPGHAEWFSESQDKMGTRVEVQLWHDDASEARRLIIAAMAEFDRIEIDMSTYRTDSEISRLNARAADKPVTVSPELFGLIDRSMRLSEKTGGAFDITFDSIGRLYDFRAEVRPTETEIAEGLATIDYRQVRLDHEASQIRFARPGVRINLGGIAKGYAVESVIRQLGKAGVRHALASAGGDTRLLGKRRDKPWIIGVRDPDDATGFVTRLALDDEAVSTSGDYERFFIEDGVRYHHILNPSTGKSASEIRSVTVVGPDATMTDGLSTSVFVLGPQDGLALIETLPDYEAILVDKAHRVRFSTGLDPR